MLNCLDIGLTLQYVINQMTNVTELVICELIEPMWRSDYHYYTLKVQKQKNYIQIFSGQDERSYMRRRLYEIMTAKATTRATVEL